ncbi:MAG: pyridoxal phosphate-dependent aminotransferase [Flavobacteriales bacterium]|nr:pyridoxal phosphate-dependent aminotransferase [Flavobacteriales bacterium]
MPKISLRGKNIPESPIRKLVPYSRKAKSRGIKVFHLNIGQPDILSPSSAIKAIKNIELDILPYSESEGNLSYRKSLKKYYQSFGINTIDESNFVATNGASEALMLTLSTICDNGDEVIIPEPYYANYNGFLHLFDINVVPIISEIDKDFALPDINKMQKKITSKTKAVLLCNPNNPTGYVYSKEELKKIGDFCLKNDIFLIVDEVYREFVYETEHHSILSFNEYKDIAIVIDSESKRYSMTGIRLGFVVTQNQEVINAVIKAAQTRLSPPLLAQICATAAHESNDNYLVEAKEEYLRRRNTLSKLLEDVPNIKFSIPKGAFYSIVELPIDNSDNFAKWLLDEFSLDNQTIMVAPATGFYSNSKLGEKQIRIAYVLNEEDLKICIKILKKALEEYPNKQ